MSEPLIDQIRSKLEMVQERVYQAARVQERDPDSIRLVVVTKNQPAFVVDAAIQAGAKILGENYAEEAIEKMSVMHLRTGVEWHMIGHVQSRKVNLVAANFTLLHSLDSLKLAKKLDKSLNDLSKKLPVLLEFNIADEMSKSGWQAGGDSNSWHTFLPEIEQLIHLTHLDVRGLMAMPPFSNDPENSRLYFCRLRELRDYLNAQFPGLRLEELSMGTSSDYGIAVEEGASYIRVGQAILGERHKNEG